MTITILCPNALLKDSELQELCNNYIKRIKNSVQIIEVKYKSNSNDTDSQAKEKQGEALLNHLKTLSSKTAIITLDERGKQLASPDFAKKLSDFQTQGMPDFCFIIGGAYGLSHSVLDRADLKLSLGTMVWPHRLVGVMILEQIYRAQQINAGHPYHKA